MTEADARMDSETLARARACPVLTGAARAEYRTSVRAGSDLSIAIQGFLQAQAQEDQVAWLKTSVAAGKTLFQPWSMEVLFTLAVLGKLRFNELHGLLGMSTRTLSDKLRTLREAGFVEREVFDEQPVRIEYRLTRQGRAIAALATPLFTGLNLAALRAAGRVGGPSRP